MIIDAHQHVWDLERVSYDWLGPELGVLYRSFQMLELVPQLDQCGIDHTVLVQAAHSYDDTEYLLEVARRHRAVVGVVGWVPLAKPGEAERALGRFLERGPLCGVRHLIYMEDPEWLARRDVTDGLRVLADAGVAFDVVALTPRHLEHVTTIAERVPTLRVVIDNLAHPPIEQGGWEPWAGLMARAAECPNVYAKVSGLNTAAARETWTADDLRPYVDLAIERFGPERLMFGGNWPVCLQAGTYDRVCTETRRTLEQLGPKDRAAVLAGTAVTCYRLAFAQPQEREIV
jgi:L-fuconolactonase